MPFEPLRFVHAAGLFVDHQLHDLPQLSDDAQTIVDEATAVAFERVVAAVIEHRADFLLLSGDTFHSEDCSLRAEVLLRRNFEKLAEHDIRVVIAPGFADPADAWRGVRELSDNVTLLLETNDDPVAVIRDGKVIASVASLDVGSLRGLWTTRDTNMQKGEPQRGPLKIGILICNEGSRSVDGVRLSDVAPLLADCRLDYLALGGVGERQTIAMKTGLAHHPGSVQAIGECECGPRGCTLIEVDQTGAVKSSFIPTAVVRRERFEIVADEQADQHQLSSQFHQALEQRTPESGERLWLVDWKIRGASAQFELLADSTRYTNLLQGTEFAERGSVKLVHACRVKCDNLAEDALIQNGMMLADFLAAIGGAGKSVPHQLAECFSDAAPKNTAWLQALEPLVREIDGESVMAETRKLGAKWFAPAASAEEHAA